MFCVCMHTIRPRIRIYIERDNKGLKHGERDSDREQGSFGAPSCDRGRIGDCYDHSTRQTRGGPPASAVFDKSSASTKTVRVGTGAHENQAAAVPAEPSGTAPKGQTGERRLRYMYIERKRNKRCWICIRYHWSGPRALVRLFWFDT